ncbi:hypothetical protein SAMN05518846_11781 [Brevibacillus centrosporus]|uniref:Uncharacterized protein n=1 Tax=Brevibacillus centrosporus TaxID=54910 RepID=A0A1I4BDB3_9BACL|nr:hypothetical protein EDM55_20825 [Brevibacillus centrosporus]SFK66794.1 hypothetical protein SAMN05518846_11781 [Brevibacillus centrosporus]
MTISKRNNQHEKPPRKVAFRISSVRFQFIAQLRPVRDAQLSVRILQMSFHLRSSAIAKTVRVVWKKIV